MSAWLISLSTHNIFKFHSCCSMYQNLILGLGILVKKQLIIDIDLLMDSQFYYTDYYVYFKSVPYSIDDCCFLLSFEIKKSRSSNFVLLAILGCLHFQMNIRIILSISARSQMEFWGGLCRIYLGSTVILTLSVPVHEH